MPYPLTSRFYNPYGPITTFLVNGVQPPADRYLGPSDQLLLSVWNPTVTINGNLGLLQLDLKGQVQPYEQAIAFTANGATPNTVLLPAAEGFLLSAIVAATGVKRGQAFCQLSVQRNLGGSNNAKGHVLLQDYVTDTDAVGYPQSPIRSSLDGRGWMREILVPAPAVDTPLTLTVPAGVRWRLHSVQAIISGVSTAVSAVLSVLDAGSNVLQNNITPTVMSAGMVNTMTWSTNAFNGTANDATPGDPELIGSTLPIDMILVAGQVIKLFYYNHPNQATVQVGATRFLVEEFVEV